MTALPGHAAPPAILPEGLQVIQGQASVVTQGQRMTVNNSAGAVLNWQRFSIGSDQSVYFQQPSTGSQVLNRVLGTDPSHILGQLGSNGRVWLLNPHGVLFGRDARIDVAGLVASTLQVSDADWRAQRLRLFDDGGKAAVINDGEIRTTLGGQVLLVGGAGGVSNAGLIEAPGGQVMLAAGATVELVDSSLPRLALKLSAPQGEALNLGRIVASGGRVDLMAAMVNQNGIVRADALHGGAGGQVLLSASDDLRLGADSVTAATAAQGTRGGQVTLQGARIGLLDNAQVDVSGAQGGGQVLVGGGLQGRDASLRNADAVYMAPGARIRADALQRGDGGLIVLWSDRATRAYGHLSARGGLLGGDGGFIETSGGWLDARPASVQTLAPAGRAGRWLLDPLDITITDETQDSGIIGGPDFSSNGSPATLSTATLAAALNAGNHVSVTTGYGQDDGEGIYGFGDIRMVNANLKVAPGSPVSLTLNAQRNIVLDFTSIVTEGAALSVHLNAAHGGDGAVSVRGSTLRTGGGDITIGGQAYACGFNQCLEEWTGALANDYTGLRNGVTLASSTLDAGSGRIQVRGASEAQNGDAAGVAVVDGSTLRARDIELQGLVDSSGNYERTGVKLAGGPIVATRSLRVDGAAYSEVYQVDSYPTGVDVLSELRVDAAEGENEALLHIAGYTVDASLFAGEGGYGGLGPLEGNPYPANEGLSVRRFGVGIRGGSGKLVATGGAHIEITGADLSGNGDYALYVAGSAAGVIDASQAGGLRLEGSGDMHLAGDLRAPDGGELSVSTSGVLSFLGAQFSGAPSSVWLQGSTVEIGSPDAPSRLVFGGAGDVTVKAYDFRIGLPAVGNALRDGGADVVFAGAAAAGQKRALASPAELPAATHLLASEGRLQVLADSVEIGAGAVLHAGASGNALTLAADGESANLLQFVNEGGAGALSTPMGHWLVWAWEPGDDSRFETGGLRPDFRQYSAIYGNASPAAAGNAFLFGTDAQLSLSGEGRVSKVYDGNTAIDLAASDLVLSGLRGGDSLDGELRFHDRHVGEGKALVLASAGVTGIVGADGVPVYGYTLDNARLLGDISARPLELTGVSVANKRYDGNDQAGITGWTLSGLVAGDQVSAQGSARFASANVGSEWAVTAQLSGIHGNDAGNYLLGEVRQVMTTADITPASLSYVATPVSLTAGAPLPALAGTVSGLVNGETLAGATSGSLVFSAAVEGTSQPGLYAINGSGLSAVNYSFVQAPGNATALQIAAPPVEPAPPVPEIRPLETVAALAPLQSLLPAALASTPQVGRSLDALQAVQSGSEGTSFGSLDLAAMPQDTVAAVLAARDEYKKTVFAQALSRLEQNPALADAAGCATAQQAASGQCLMITPLDNAAVISNARVIEQRPVGAAPAPAPAAGPTPAATTVSPPAVQPPAPAAPAAAPTPSAPPAPAVAAAPTLRPVATVVPSFPQRRAVQQASLPQIQRKLAVVIGIDQYANPRIPQLANAVNDARAVAESLRQRLGYETLVVENPDRAALFRVLNRLAAETGPQDSVVLYYAGHGEVVEKTGLGYWQPSDADPARPETWVSNADIQRVLRQIGASQVALISDSCFSGALAGEARIEPAGTGRDAGQFLSRRAAVVMTSGGNEPVFDSGKNGHSPFAWSLMQTLDKVADWRPGSNIFAQVRFAVARQLPQRPQYSASLTAGHEAGADYLFEQRRLEGLAP